MAAQGLLGVIQLNFKMPEFMVYERVDSFKSILISFMYEL